MEFTKQFADTLRAQPLFGQARRVTGGEDDRQIGSMQQLPGEIRTLHPRHGQVGGHEIKRARVRQHKIERLDHIFWPSSSAAKPMCTYRLTSVSRFAYHVEILA